MRARRLSASTICVAGVIREWRRRSSRCCRLAARRRCVRRLQKASSCETCSTLLGSGDSQRAPVIELAMIDQEGRDIRSGEQQVSRPRIVAQALFDLRSRGRRHAWAARGNRSPATRRAAALRLGKRHGAQRRDALIERRMAHEEPRDSAWRLFPSRCRRPRAASAAAPPERSSGARAPRSCCRCRRASRRR